MTQLEKYSFGIGDRFGRQGQAQLKAVLRSRQFGIELTPVWNKSFREHQMIHTLPDSVRQEADHAVEALGYSGSYYVDADHINMDTVDLFLPASDFFTLDVAKYIGQEPDEVSEEVIQAIRALGPEIQLGEGDETVMLSEELIHCFIADYYVAVSEAARLYNHIERLKGAGNFIAEVSMDEVDQPQTPVDLLLILFMLSYFHVPVQTIAPKFSGRFNKGVDYVGQVTQFRDEFKKDLLVIQYAIQVFGLPENLKLSIHSGSDKFSIYPVIGELIREYQAGIHVKTAGTTWLEEVIGLCLGDQQSLAFVHDLYAGALQRKDELCSPYADVIDIDADHLPDSLQSFNGDQIADMLRHIPDHPDYNPSIRQLIHVGYKLAAEQRERYLSLLDKHAEIIAKQVEENIFDRHISRLFG